MECSGCGNANPADAAFCEACGRRLERRCAACGAPSSPGARFCARCGAALEEGRLPAAARSPRDYTPRHLAERILHSRSALEGERKQVTVLFADVRSSMELSERLDPEEWHAILERFFEILTEGVHRFEGTVNQYTGDGVMALFGAPIAHEDHAQRACYAALHLRDSLREHAREVKRRHGLDFATRIGLHSGDVVVGKIGDDLRMDYTAQGHTVGLAQRMEALAAAGSIYLSAATAALVSGWFALEDLGEFRVKGAAEPLRVFELRGVGPVRTRFDLSRARGLTRFVGRQGEMALLEAALEQALAGPGRTVGVVAQAGTGKTRLCFELAERCRARGLTVLEARGLAHGRQIPLLPALELMRAFFGIDARDGERATREKIAGRVLLLDESLKGELPIFFDLLGVPDPARPLPAMDPEALQRRMHAAVRALARAEGRAEPGVLLVEDLHWLDPASDALIEQVIAGNAESQSLVLVNFRPEYRARWMSQSHYQQLSLLPLSEEALRELLRDLVGEDPSVGALPDAIYARTGGNPFFIEEVVRSLVEDGSLEGERGAYRLARPIEDLPLPETVQAVLAARIDRLPEREKHVLQAASVIGKTFGERLLARVVELPERELEAALASLQDAEFLYEASLYPEREYTFKHPLTQEVADRSQLRDRRRRAHATAARATLELDADRLDERAALLAHHYEGAEEPIEAARWHARAAAWIGASDPAEALHHWRRTRELSRGRDDPEADALLARACGGILLMGWRIGLPDEELHSALADYRAVSARTRDNRGLAQALHGFATNLNFRAAFRAAKEASNEALAIARELGARDLEVEVLCQLSDDPLFRGEPREGIAICERVLELADEAHEMTYGGGLDPVVECRMKRGVLLSELGRHAEGSEDLERALQHAQRGRLSRENVALGLSGSVWRQPLLGPTVDALACTLRLAELAEELGGAMWLEFASTWGGRVLQMLGRHEESIVWLERGLEIQRTRRVGVPNEALALAGLAEADLALGRLDLARSAAREAVAAAERHGTRIHEISAQLALARVLLAEGGREREAIEAALARVEALVAETEARAHLPFVVEVRAALSRALGDEAEAARQLREAHRLFVEMGATGHAERLARELGA
jgi:class 3 adenylate cyclase/tetratricopeptide (TPR) repeat protein